MTIRLSSGGVIALEGDCPSEDAEVLVQHLLADPASIVDWSACESAHSAVIQVLLAARPAMRGAPTAAALRNWVYPVLSPRGS